MPRFRSKPLRGSVTQNYLSRVHPRPLPSRFGLAWRLALLVGTACGLLILAAWLWHSGWPEKQVERVTNASLRVTQRARFAINDIMVEGRTHTGKEEILAALDTTAGTPIFGFDLNAAHERLRQLPWVRNVSIERRLPDAIVIHLTEREPMARWQNEGQIVVIDNDGAALPNAKTDDFASLPLVVGPDAPTQAATLLNALKDFPTISNVLKAGVRVGERRWNLHVQPGVLVRLPEKNMAAALKQLADLIQEQKVLERNVIVIDLRLPDRLIIEPGTPGSISPTDEVRP